MCRGVTLFSLSLFHEKSILKNKEEYNNLMTLQMENKKRMPQQAPQAKADKAPAEQDTALVWGKNPVTELLKSEAGVDTLLLADSMEPRISDGDLALVHRQNTLDNGDLGVLVYGSDGEGTLKKYIQRGNSVVLHPFNPAYEEMVIKGEELDHLYIAGKVVETKAKW